MSGLHADASRGDGWGLGGGVVPVKSATQVSLDMDRYSLWFPKFSFGNLIVENKPLFSVLFLFFFRCTYFALEAKPNHTGYTFIWCEIIFLRDPTATSHGRGAFCSNKFGKLVSLVPMQSRPALPCPALACPGLP